jgi:hypothetical protein
MRLFESAGRTASVAARAVQEHVGAKPSGSSDAQQVSTTGVVAQHPSLFDWIAWKQIASEPPTAHQHSAIAAAGRASIRQTTIVPMRRGIFTDSS